MEVWWKGRLGYRMLSKVSDRVTSNGCNKVLQSGPLRPALKGAPMDIIYHSEIGTQHTMIEVMNHIKVQLK